MNIKVELNEKEVSIIRNTVEERKNNVDNTLTTKLKDSNTSIKEKAIDVVHTCETILKKLG